MATYILKTLINKRNHIKKTYIPIPCTLTESIFSIKTNPILSNTIVLFFHFLTNRFICLSSKNAGKSKFVGMKLLLSLKYRRKDEQKKKERKYKMKSIFTPLFYYFGRMNTKIGWFDYIR